MSREMRFAPLLAGALLLLRAGLALASPPCGSCGPPTTHCPPAYKHYYEGPPNIKFKKACPRPVCDPCQLPHFGYFQPCWAPWPYGEDWSHCPYPTASHMLPPPQVPPYAPRVPVEVERYRDGRYPTDPRTTPEQPKPKTIPKLPDPKPLDEMGHDARPLPVGPILRIRVLED